MGLGETKSRAGRRIGDEGPESGLRHVYENRIVFFIKQMHHAHEI
jgi:hypothetical protein